MPHRAVWVVVPAAGQGNRMGSHIPKQYLPLLGRTVLEHTLRCFLPRLDIAGVVLVLAADDAHWDRLSDDIRSPKIILATGGAVRQESVYNGLCALHSQADEDDWVLVHDAARPCLHQADIDALMCYLSSTIPRCAGALLAVPVQDTLKRSDDGQRVSTTVDRSGLWRALTPQMFRLGPLRAALTAANAAGQVLSDEAMAMEHAGHAVVLVAGRADNIKITCRPDLDLAARILQRD